MTVLDASAFLGHIRSEPGGERVRELIGSELVMSAVTYAEVLSRLSEFGLDPHSADDEMRREGLVGQAVQVLPFTEADAIEVGDLRAETRQHGLSLGDRACLTVARRLRQPVFTADQLWAQLDLEVDVELIRS